MDLRRGFSAGQVAKLAGLKYDTLDYWARTGFLVPSIMHGSGTGNSRVYSFTDIVAARAARELREAGIALQALRRVVAFLRERFNLDHPLAQARLVVSSSGDVILALDNEELISALNRPGQGILFIVDVRRIWNELEERAA